MRANSGGQSDAVSQWAAVRGWKPRVLWGFVTFFWGPTWSGQNSEFCLARSCRCSEILERI
jgi:hypothetical protein